MAPVRWPLDEVVEVLAAPGPCELAGRLVVVEPPAAPVPAERAGAAGAVLSTLPCVLVGAPGWAPGTGDPVLELLDAVLDEVDDLAAVEVAVGRAPVAASALCLHLRPSARRSVADGLVAESALYSALQAGAEHRVWRAATPVRERPVERSPRVRLARQGNELQVTLARPAARNALDARLRDELLAALAVAEADPDLVVVLAGDGPTFCAGGDLDEFGTASDPAAAHIVRLQASLAVVLCRLADRLTVRLHGACAGSGVELAAFAGRVVATPDATVRLPELTLGLIPGAGGTVGLPRRIGRHRTAWLALTGREVDADTARSWGLIDEIALS